METNYREISYNNDIVNVLQYIAESNCIFEAKINYIRKLEKAGFSWKEADTMSKIWSNIKYKKCKYPAEIYHKIMYYDGK